MTMGLFNMDYKFWTKLCIAVVVVLMALVYTILLVMGEGYKLEEATNHLMTLQTQARQQQPEHQQQLPNSSQRRQRILTYGLMELVPWQPFNKTRDVLKGDNEEAYHRLINRLDLECMTRERLGKITDGGWDICLAGPYEPKSPCLVYSFGIANDFSFDDAITKMYKCKLRAFDPTMKIQVEQNRSEYITFYPEGLSGNVGTRQIGGIPRKMSTLGALRKRFGEEQTVIDYLKMDIEGSEWDALQAMFKDGFLQKYVKQIGIEFHYFNNAYLQELDVQTKLESLGFRKWMNHWNMHCKMPGLKGLKLSRCNEVYFLNIHFLKK